MTKLSLKELAGFRIGDKVQEDFNCYRRLDRKPYLKQFDPALVRQGTIAYFAKLTKYHIVQPVVRWDSGGESWANTDYLKPIT